jgi:phosphate transport system substrate-binding protein
MPRWLIRLVIVAVAVSCLRGLGGPVRAAGPDQAELENALAIIVNTENPVSDLSLRELRKVFLGDRGHWPNSHRITLVMMEASQPERKALLREVVQMTESDFTHHFLNGVFTGELFASPKTLSSPVGVRKFVFNVPGAIGYVRASDLDSTVKVIRIDGHLPSDKDYPLHILPEHPERAAR